MSPSRKADAKCLAPWFERGAPELVYLRTYEKILPILTVGGMSLTGCATIDALEYGAPPMGGIAFGLDRSVTLMCEKWDSIRDVIAFPKTQRGQDLMVDAPSVVPEKQLRDLHIKLRNVAPKAVTE